MFRLPPTTRLLVEVVLAAAEPDLRVDARAVDGSAFLAEAAHHQLLPLMADLHSSGRLNVPDAVSEPLRSEAAASTVGVLLRERFLVRLGRAMDRARVEFVVLKGAALAHTIYPRVAWRPYVDLDILVRRADYQRAANVLGTLGQAPSPRMNVRRRLRFFNAVEFVAVDGSAAHVDLHWNDVSASWSDRSVLTEPEVWTEKRPVRLADQTLFTLSLPRTLVHLAVHWGYHHQFRSLLTLLDLLLVLGRCGPEEWAAAWRIARSCRCGRVLGLSMAVVAALTGRSDEALVDLSALSQAGRRRALSAVERLFQRGGVWRSRRVKAMCLDSRLDRWRALKTFLAAKLLPWP